MSDPQHKIPCSLAHQSFKTGLLVVDCLYFPGSANFYNSVGVISSKYPFLTTISWANIAMFLGEVGNQFLVISQLHSSFLKIMS